MDYKKMSFIFGIIIFISMIGLLLAIMWLSGTSTFFSWDYWIYAKFSDITGMKDQSQIYMRGYSIGFTRGATFEKDGVVIKLVINQRYRIPKGSKFEIITINLIGERAIAIVPTDANEFIPSNAVVQGENNDILTMVQNVLQSFKKNLGDAEKDNKIHKLVESIDLLHSVLQKMDGKLNQIHIMEYEKQINKIGAAGQSIQDFVKDSQKTITVINQVVEKLNQGQGSAGELLNNRKYVESLNDILNEFKKLLQDIKKKPKRYFRFTIF